MRIHWQRVCWVSFKSVYEPVSFLNIFCSKLTSLSKPISSKGLPPSHHPWSISLYAPSLIAIIPCIYASDVCIKVINHEQVGGGGSDVSGNPLSCMDPTCTQHTFFRCTYVVHGAAHTPRRALIKHGTVSSVLCSQATPTLHFGTQL